MLLPIGNKALLAYVLDMLEGLAERFHGPVLISTHADFSRPLQAYLNSLCLFQVSTISREWTYQWTATTPSKW
jgi:hypothetical protein